MALGATSTSRGAATRRWKKRRRAAALQCRPRVAPRARGGCMLACQAGGGWCLLHQAQAGRSPHQAPLGATGQACWCWAIPYRVRVTPGPGGTVQGGQQGQQGAHMPREGSSRGPHTMEQAQGVQRSGHAAAQARGKGRSSGLPQAEGGTSKPLEVHLAVHDEAATAPFSLPFTLPPSIVRPGHAAGLASLPRLPPLPLSHLPPCPTDAPTPSPALGRPPARALALTCSSAMNGSSQPAKSGRRLMAALYTAHFMSACGPPGRNSRKGNTRCEVVLVM